MSKLFLKLVQIIGMKAATAVAVTTITITGGAVCFAGYEIATYVSQQNDSLSLDTPGDVGAQSDVPADSETDAQIDPSAGTLAEDKTDAQMDVQADASADAQADADANVNAQQTTENGKTQTGRNDDAQNEAMLAKQEQMIEPEVSLVNASLQTVLTGSAASTSNISSQGSAFESAIIVPDPEPVPNPNPEPDPDQEPEPERQFINRESELIETYKIEETNEERYQSYYLEQYKSIFSEEAPQKKYTVMVYLCGTDLETNSASATSSIESMLKSQYNTEEMNVLICAGGTSEWKNDYMGGKNEDGCDNDSSRCAIYYLDPKAVAGTDVSLIDQSSINENSLKRLYECERIDMGEPSLLASFINYGTNFFPAENYGTILWNHGGGIIGGVCFSETVIDEKGKSFEGTSITASELESVLASTNLYQEKGQKMAFIGYDACLMSGIEQAYLVSPYCDYSIASSEVSYGDWNYQKIFDCMAEHIEATNDGDEVDNEAIAKEIAKIYYDTHDGTSTNVATISCFDSSQIQEVSAGIESVSEAIMELYDAEDEADEENEENAEMRRACFQALKQARIHSFMLGTATNRTDNYDYVDLNDFFSSLKKEFANLATEYSEDEEKLSQIEEIQEKIQELLESYRSAALVEGVKLHQAVIAYRDGTARTSGNEGFWSAIRNGSIGACSIYMPYYKSSEEMASYAGMDIMPAYVELLEQYSEDRAGEVERISQLMQVIDYRDIIEKNGDQTVSMQQIALDNGVEQKYIHLSIKEGYENTEENHKYDGCGTTPFADFMDTIQTVSVYASRLQKAKDESANDIHIVYGSTDLSFSEISTKDESINILKESLEDMLSYRVEGTEQSSDKKVYDYATLLSKESYKDIIVDESTDQTISDTWLTFAGKLCWFDRETLAKIDASLHFYKESDDSEDEKYVFGGATYSMGDEQEATLSKETLLNNAGFSAVQFQHYMIKDSQLEAIEDENVESNGFKTPTLFMNDLYIYKESLKDDSEYNDYTLGFTSVEYTSEDENEDTCKRVIMDAGQCQENPQKYADFVSKIGTEIPSGAVDDPAQSNEDGADKDKAKAIQVETASTNAETLIVLVGAEKADGVSGATEGAVEGGTGTEDSAPEESKLDSGAAEDAAGTEGAAPEESKLDSGAAEGAAEGAAGTEGSAPEENKTDSDAVPKTPEAVLINMESAYEEEEPAA